MVRKTIVVTKYEYYLLGFFAMCYMVEHYPVMCLLFTAYILIGSAIEGKVWKASSWPLRLLVYVIPPVIFAACTAYYAYSGRADGDYGLSRAIAFLEDEGGTISMFYLILGFFCKEMLERKNSVSRFLFRNVEEEDPVIESKDKGDDDA